MTAEILAGAAAISALISCVSLGYAMTNGRAKRMAAKLKSLEDALDTKADLPSHQVQVGKLDLVEDRVTRIEAKMDHLPDHKTANALRDDIADLSSKVEVLSERIRPIAAITERLLEDALQQKSGAA